MVENLIYRHLTRIRTKGSHWVLPDILNALDQCKKCGLNRTKGQLFSVVCRILIYAPGVFTLASISTLLFFIGDQEWHGNLIYCLVEYIPEDLMKKNL
jgi:hypothetical protein